MTGTGQRWAIASLEFIFLHKEQSSRCVTVERLTWAIFRSDIFKRKSWITSVLLLLSLLPQAHLQIISLSFLRDLAVLMSTADVAVRWFFPWFCGSLLVPLFRAASWMYHFLFPWKSLPFHMCFQWLNYGKGSVSSHWGIGLLTPPEKLLEPNTFVLLWRFLTVKRKI